MNANSPDLIVIGASWGGLAAISRILNLLPPDFPIPIVVAQHQHPDSIGNMVQVLRSKTKLNICDIEGITEIVEHRVYVIPANYHGLIENRHSISLNIDGLVHYSRPSIDVLFETAADVFGKSLAGVLLTGANEDGAAGLSRIKKRGGLTVVQDPDEAEADAMPRAAIETFTPDHILKLDEIGELLRCLAL